MSSRAVVLIARHKLLLILPFLIAIPAAIAYALLSGSDTYQSVGRVWVERPSFLRSAGTESWDPYLSPAQNQATLLQQRLRTDEFAERVASVASEDLGAPITADDVQRGAWAGTDGSNLVLVGFNGPDPKVATAVAAAVITEYAEVQQEQIVEAAKRAEVVYAEEVETAQAEATAAREAFSEHQARCPSCGTGTIVDPRYLELRDEADRARTVYEQALADLRGVRLIITQTEETQPVTFRMQDAPEEPAAPLARKKISLIGPPAFAMLLAIAISAATFGVIYTTDRTLYTAEDTSLIPNLRLLGTVPELPRQAQELAATDFSGTRRGRSAFVRGRD
jgi:uncharacterized protein involved in exopolysaccharide biosynthesis